MPEYMKFTTGGAQIAIWHIKENEQELKAYIGGDSFPVLTQFQDKNRRLEWLAARCSLKLLGITEPIMYEVNRRPYVVSGTQNISISHSFPFVAVICSRTFDVGLDIESLARPFDRIYGKFLTLGESTWLNLDDDFELALVWSAKEAFFKLRLPATFNSFTDMVVLPLQRPLGTRGVLRAKVALWGLGIQTVALEYRFLADYVMTWVSCNPYLLPKLTEEEQYE